MNRKNYQFQTDIRGAQMQKYAYLFSLLLPKDSFHLTWRKIKCINFFVNSESDEIEYGKWVETEFHSDENIEKSYAM